MILFLALRTHQGGTAVGDSLEDLSGPMEAGRPGGAFGPKSALFPGAVADLPDGGTNAFAS